MSAYHAFHASACGSVAASMRGPLEPTRIGGPPGRAGRGSSSASRATWYVPWKSIRPSASSVRTIVNASSKRAMRWSNGAPSAANSVSFQPAPMPSTRRPPEISSTVAACFASMNGAWKPIAATSGPIVTRSVASARPASVVHASHGPRVDPSA